MPIIASGQLTLIDLNDAKQLAMYIGASRARTVIYDGVSTYTPNYATSNQVLTPQLYIAGDNTDIAHQATSIRWFYQINGAGAITEITASGTDYTLGTGAVKTLTIKTNVLATRTSMTYICEVIYPDTTTGFNIVTKSEIELIKVSNGRDGVDGVDGTSGSNAIVGVLSNEAHALPATSAGAVTTYGGATATFSIYNGATDDTANWTIVQTRSTGTVVTEATSSRVATVTGVTTDVATVTFTASRSGYSNVSKVFTLTKVKGGASGADGSDGSDGSDSTSYWIVTPPAIQKNRDGVYNPSSVTINLKSQTGTGAVENYLGRITVEDSTNGTTFTSRYTSSANESTRSYTPLANIKALRVRMHLAGVTPNGTNHIDEQIITVVADGTDSIYASVWNPEGNAVRNGNGTVKCTADLYRGSTTVTASAYKWYAQDPTATTTSGGDADGGNGWRLINSTFNLGITGYTTATITVPAGAVTGMESFKAVMTYNAIKYSGVTTVVDLSDPILVRLDGLDRFKNGQGSTTIRATLLRAGAEIDSNGTTYTYTWSIYNADNIKTAFTAVGKSVTINATDIDGRGNLVCEVEG